MINKSTPDSCASSIIAVVVNLSMLIFWTVSHLEMIVKLNIKALTISTVALFLFAALLFPLLSQSLWEPFTPAKLDALNQSGQPVLVAVHADWCST
jgi:thiol:disulfide interchange protein